jgi:phage shock protein E
VKLDPLTIAILAVVAFLVLKRLLGVSRAPAEMVKEKIKGGAKIVDVRTPAEFREGSYPGAINIPLQDIAQRMSELPKNKAVVVFCRSGSRSAMTARAMKRAGFAEVINAGGLGHMPR